MTILQHIRKQIPYDIFDYQTLVTTLSGYSSPRDRISRFLRKGEIIQLKRGLYVFHDDLRRSPLSLMYIANVLYGPSYVSLESALQYHSLIPERVFEITSVTPGRSRHYSTPVGNFSYQHIPLSAFSAGIDIVYQKDNGSYLIACPEKALVDKVQQGPSIRSKSAMIQYLFDDLRVDPEEMEKLNLKKIKKYCKVYHTSRSRLLEGVFAGRGGSRIE